MWENEVEFYLGCTRTCDLHVKLLVYFRLQTAVCINV